MRYTMKRSFPQIHQLKSFLILFVLLNSLYITGCTTYNTSAEVNKNHEKQKIDPPSGLFISDVYLQSTDKTIKLGFILSDMYGDSFAIKGTGKIRIMNSEMEEVYSEEFIVNPEDFKIIQDSYSGKDIPSYYKHILMKNVNPSISSAGTIFLDFKTESEIFEQQQKGIYNLPKFSGTELYEKTSKTINHTISEGSFEITLLKVGVIETTRSNGKKEEFFRADMEVKNIGENKENFLPTGLAILDNKGNQYDVTYRGSLEILDDYHPNVKKAGHLLFQKFPEETKNISLVFELGYDSDLKPFLFTFEIELD